MKLVEPIDLAMIILKSKKQATLEEWGVKRPMDAAGKEIARRANRAQYNVLGDPSHYPSLSEDWWDKWTEIPSWVRYFSLEKGHPLRPTKQNVYKDWLKYNDIDDFEPREPGTPFTSEENKEWRKIRRKALKDINRTHIDHGRLEKVRPNLPDELFDEDENFPRLTVRDMMEGPQKGESVQTILPNYDWALDKYSGWKGVEPVFAYRSNPVWSNILARKRGRMEAYPMTEDSMSWEEQYDNAMLNFETWKEMQADELRKVMNSLNYWHRQVAEGPRPATADDAKRHHARRNRDDVIADGMENKGTITDLNAGGLEEHHLRHEREKMWDGADEPGELTIGGLMDKLYDKAADLHIDMKTPFDRNDAFQQFNIANRAVTHGWGEASNFHRQAPITRRQPFETDTRHGFFVYPANTRDVGGMKLREEREPSTMGLPPKWTIEHKKITDELNMPLPSERRGYSSFSLPVSTAPNHHMSLESSPHLITTTRPIGIRGDPFRTSGQFANLGQQGEQAEGFIEQDIPIENLVFGRLPKWMTSTDKLEAREANKRSANQWGHMNFDMIDWLNRRRKENAPVPGTPVEITNEFATVTPENAPIVGWEHDGDKFNFKDIVGNTVHTMTPYEAQQFAGDERGWVL